MSELYSDAYQQGVSYSLSSITLPSLLHLPTAPLASQTHNYIRTHGRAAQRFLSILSISALSLAYILSPRRSRHPYLIWTALACGLGATPKVVDRIAARVSGSSRSHSSSERSLKAEEQLSESGVMVGQSSSSEDEEDINGEVVRRAVEKSQVVEQVKTGLWGLGFVMGVVGIWGDGA
jgi:autophagy-related protein 33